MNENLKPGGPADDPDRTEQLDRTEQSYVAPPGPDAGPGAGQVPDPATASPAPPSVTERLAALSGRPSDAPATTTDGPVTFDEPVRVPESRAGSAPLPLPAAPAPPSGPSAPPAVSAPAVPARAAGVRVGTVVWGLVVVAIGVGLLATAAGYRIDLQVAAILLLGVAGVALVGGSILTSLRRRR